MRMSSAERSARYRAKDVDAYREKKAEYAKTPEQREKRRQYMAKWREANREKHNQYSRNRYTQRKDDPEFKTQSRSYLLKMKYGITHDDYERMLAAQNGKCLICETNTPGKNSKHFHIDHCHTTGRVRGLLCAYCNTGIGWFERYAEKAEKYVK